ncbi:T-complex protein 1 subunit alpha [Ananas comosus]|uniref:T-complex protein 1 subunit alpha n=1 Tax=Ananas comosus TaxID=4615 RepID=A0A199UNF9_ANACO|nr:T-complex protein 1 subunit alpha [Ananas comosus]
MAITAQSPDIFGERHSGQDVRTQNVMACQAVANIVKSSLGPVGLDKMLVDDIGDVTITNDGATILKMLEVEHPAAKVLVELAELQDREVGDGTTSVVIVAAELLKLAMREACKYVEEKLAVKVEKLGKDSLVNCAKTSMSSKLIAADSDFFANLYFVGAGAIAVRRVRKEDLRHVAKASGATVVTTFADMEGEETFDPSFLGYADEVVEEKIADDDVILVKGTKNTSAVSLILRGANDYMLDEIDRSLHDAICIVKRTLESNTVVAGGGAVEAALSVYLEYLATTLGSREQLAIAEFAEALLIIPKVLAVNAAKDATELVAMLRAYHHASQTKADKQHLSSIGLDLLKGTIRNNLEAGVIEPAMSKVKIIQFATEAAITILRIDDMIKLAKEDENGED